MLYYIYNDVDNLVGFKYNNDLYYYQKNAQEDIIGILDSSYNVVAKYEYDSWGSITSVIDANGNDISSNSSHIGNINPFRYRSYYYDVETSLYYLNSRYYNPSWGRFVNADNYISTDSGLLVINMFAYCNNNPINNYDSSGKILFKIASILIKSAAKTIKKITKSITEIKKAIKYTITAAKYIKDAFIFEVGGGTGNSISGNVFGEYTTGLGKYQDYTIGIKNGKTFETVKGSTYIELGGFGASQDYELNFPTGSYEKGYIDGCKISDIECVKRNDNTIIEPMEFTFFSDSKTDSNISSNGTFVGIDFNAHLGIGGHFIIGFNIKW